MFNILEEILAQLELIVEHSLLAQKVLLERQHYLLELQVEQFLLFMILH